MLNTKAVSAAARHQGRKRRMSPTEALPGSKGAAKETVKYENEVNLVNHEEENKVATSRSTLGRRRSGTEGLRSSHGSQGGPRVWHWKSSQGETHVPLIRTNGPPRKMHLSRM